MKVLVTGREGQLARSLAERATGHAHEMVFFARPDLDLSDPASIRQTVAHEKPAVIINAAAFTAVDKAEDELELAMAINGKAPGILAEEAHRIGARIIQISTDYVFDGSGNRPWREDDATGPLSVYGQSKLEGETAVRAAAPGSHVILRTAWVYSPFGNNFVKTMLRLAETRDALSVVADQTGNPTSALDIADGIFAILNRWKTDPEAGLGRTFHLAGTGEANWYEFASAIFAESAKRGGPSASVMPITTAEYPTKATRPANSRLNCRRLEAEFGWRAPDWHKSLAETIGRLVV